MKLNKEKVLEAIKNGANPNATDECGKSALLRLVELSMCAPLEDKIYSELAEILLNARADPDPRRIKTAHSFPPPLL